MRTLEVIQTIEWITNQFDEELKRILFAPMAIHPEEMKSKVVNFKKFEQAAISIEKIKGNKKAVEVIKAFGIDLLLSEDFLARTFNYYYGGDRDSESIMRERRDRFFDMIRLTNPLKKLTFTEDLFEKETSDTISFVFHYDNEEKTNIFTISDVTKKIDLIYNSISRVKKIEDHTKLQLIKIESGSSIRIDCKGISEVVKELKEFIIEIWNKVRHKRVEEIIQRNNVTFDSLCLIEKVHELRENKVLTPEEAERLKIDLLESTLSLVKDGVLIVEIEPVEVVDNTKLLKSFSQQFLPSPKDNNTNHNSKIKNTIHKQSKIKTKLK